jgi:DNA-binding NtrC family response regulator
MSWHGMTSTRLVAPDNLPLARPPCILVVEDEVLIRLDIADELRAQGFEVVEAASADEARELLKAIPEIDVVLTDVQMPGEMDGLALVRLVEEHWPEIKVIVMSGVWHGRHVPAAAAALQKPFHPGEVVRLVERFTNASVGDG